MNPSIVLQLVFMCAAEGCAQQEMIAWAFESHVYAIALTKLARGEIIPPPAWVRRADKVYCAGHGMAAD